MSDFRKYPEHNTESLLDILCSVTSDLAQTYTEYHNVKSKLATLWANTYYQSSALSTTERTNNCKASVAQLDADMEEIRSELEPLIIERDLLQFIIQQRNHNGSSS